MQNICTHTSAALTCIDPWKSAEVEGRFDANTAGFETLDKIKAYSHVALRTLPLDSFDFAYIDGDHEAMNVLEDAVYCFRLVKPGGLLIFDDYRWRDPHNWGVRLFPKLAVDAFLTMYEHRIEILHRGYQVFARRTS